MPFPSDLTVDVEIVPDEITAGDVLDEFIAAMTRWGHVPWVSPGSVPPEEQVTLPGPDVLARRADWATRIARAVGSGRS